MDAGASPDALQVAIAFVARAPVHMSLLSLETIHLEVSPPFLETFLIPGGRTRESHLGSSAREGNHGARSRIDDTFDRLAAGGPIVLTESGHQRNGRPFALRSQASYWRDEAGQPVAVLIVHQDITAEVEARAALARSESQLRAVIENIPAEVTLHDIEAKHMLMMNNRATAGISNATHAEVAGAVNEIASNAEAAGGSYRFDWTADSGLFAGR